MLRWIVSIFNDITSDIIFLVTSLKFIPRLRIENNSNGELKKSISCPLIEFFRTYWLIRYLSLRFYTWTKL